MAPSGGQNFNNASGAMLLPSLVQVSESISGSVVPLAMFRLIVRISTFRDKKYRILTFRDKKYRILMFRDKTESYLTVLQQNNAEAY